MRPYSTWAASSSPLTSLSRTLAQDDSLLGMILMPYFLSKPNTEAITTEAQSVRGMKPILTSSFSGLSEPPAHTPPLASPVRVAPAPAFRMVRRMRLVLSSSVMAILVGAWADTPCTATSVPAGKTRREAGWQTDGALQAP